MLQNKFQHQKSLWSNLEHLLAIFGQFQSIGINPSFYYLWMPISLSQRETFMIKKPMRLWINAAKNKEIIPIHSAYTEVLNFPPWSISNTFWYHTASPCNLVQIWVHLDMSDHTYLKWVYASYLLWSLHLYQKKFGYIHP